MHSAGFLLPIMDVEEINPSCSVAFWHPSLSELISLLFVNHFWRFLCHSKAKKTGYNFVTDGLLSFIEKFWFFDWRILCFDIFIAKEKQLILDRNWLKIINHMRKIISQCNRAWNFLQLSCTDFCSTMLQSGDISVRKRTYVLIFFKSPNRRKPPAQRGFTPGKLRVKLLS